ncbi:MAG TPA: tRNA uridine-5-carboxymethylaminomethyl(34) synthesis GTPase MnmE [Steroidobacteraceae bacterium]|jgi:tRNA modification GTPase|nr:tRNA uridine-5-carboxymethylaminomethyl(34) synthesis GTPase MnmE [Steroidobacteraceae bacterium]
MSDPDTIVAVATPPGRGGIGVVRLSGPAAQSIAAAVLGALPAARRAVFAAFRDAGHQTLDAGLALFFPGPHSYTGEDVVEFHGHGGPVILESLVARLVELGARRAAAGEFTQRAFLNDKLDLAQAEAVADLIDAGSREAARAAMRSLQGEFSTMIQVLTGAVIELRTHVEAAIDFPEEEVDFLADKALAQRLTTVRQHFDAVTRSAGQGRLLRDGMTVVLAGAPNAGKSSLLNRLAGYDAAIVTAVPGTTRDVLRERIHVDGMPLHILDTAGLRIALDAVEEEGIRRAQLEMSRADRVLFVIDGALDPSAQAYRELAGTLPAQVPVTLVYNKSDITDAGAVSAPSGVPRIDVSALTGEGLDTLRSHLKSCMGYHTLESGSVSARQRHLEALARARASIEAAAETLQETRAGELVAQELRSAQRALDEISGEFTSEDLLGRIFSSFCIGK